MELFQFLRKHGHVKVAKMKTEKVTDPMMIYVKDPDSN